MLSGLPPQCFDYKILTDRSRHYSYYRPSGGVMCDSGSGSRSPQFRGAGWYRFTGPAGIKMATKTEVTKKGMCGTHAAGHIDANTHPVLAEGQSQDQKVCFYFSSQCQWSKTVTIQKCDGFYIYKLPRPPGCSFRYCSA